MYLDPSFSGDFQEVLPPSNLHASVYKLLCGRGLCSRGSLENVKVRCMLKFFKDLECSEFNPYDSN